MAETVVMPEPKLVAEIPPTILLSEFHELKLKFPIPTTSVAKTVVVEKVKEFGIVWLPIVLEWESPTPFAIEIPQNGVPPAGPLAVPPVMLTEAIVLLLIVESWPFAMPLSRMPAKTLFPPTSVYTPV